MVKIVKQILIPGPGINILRFQNSDLKIFIPGPGINNFDHVRPHLPPHFLHTNRQISPRSVDCAIQSGVVGEKVFEIWVDFQK